MNGDQESSARLDPQNPWPGLLSFREEDQAFFGGREAAVEALARRVSTEQLTLVFGHSGLGKTSLLRAGLFPRLRLDHFFPVYIRLEYVSGRSARVQIKDEIVKQAASSNVEATPPRGDESLSDYLDRDDVDFWDERSFPCKPVLVFDQFEELFTKGRALTAGLVDELSPLTESSRRRDRVVLAIREDYVGQLESISDRFRSVFTNRFQVRRMDGDEALASVMKAGASVLDEAVARRVIRFVGGVKDDPAAEPAPDERLPVARLQIEPALLSVICSELNVTRKTAGAEKITISMLSGSKQAILTGFYERSFEGVSLALRELVEDELVMNDGKTRDSIAEQRALEKSGVTAEDIQKLVDRRVLRVQEIDDVRRMELTHDLLTPEAVSSRTKRQGVAERDAQIAQDRAAERARRAKRGKRLALIAPWVVVLLVAAFVVQRVRSGAEREARTNARLAMQAFETNRPAEGLAYLARSLRLDGDDDATRSLLYDRLLRSGWPLVVGTFDGPPPEARLVEISPDGSRVAAVNGKWIELWDVVTGKRLRQYEINESAVRSVRFLSDSRHLFVGRDGRSELWDTVADARPRILPAGSIAVSPDGTEIAEPLEGAIQFTNLATGARSTAAIPGHIESITYSPDKRYFLVFSGMTRTGDHSRIWDRVTGQFVGERLDIFDWLNIAFSNDGRTLVVIDEHAARAWDIPSGVPGDPMMAHGTILEFSPDGKRVLVGGGELRLYDLTSGRLLGTLRRDERVTSAAFSPDGLRIVTASADKTARLWSGMDGTPIGAPLVHPRGVLRAQFAEGGREIVTVADRVRRWQIPIAADPPLPQTGAAFGNFVRASGALVVFEEGAGEERKFVALGLRDGRKLWDLRAATSSPLAVSPGGAFVAIGRNLDDERVELSVHDGRNGVPLWHHDWPNETVINAKFTDGDQTVVVLTKEKSTNRVLRFISTRNWIELVKPIRTGPIGDEMLVPPGNSNVLAITDRGRPTQIWDWKSSRQIGTIPEVIAMRFSPDGKRIVVASEEGVRTIDVGTRLGEPKKLDMSGTVYSIEFSPDGRTMIMASDAEVVLWDAAADEKRGNSISGILLFEPHFSADSTRVALTFYEETVQVFDVATATPVTQPMPTQAMFAAMSADGNALLHVRDKTVVRVEVPRGSSGESLQLARLAEAVAGLRVTDDGITRIEPQTELAALARECAGKSDRPCRFVQWFHHDRARVISPLSAMTITQFVRKRLQWSPESWMELATMYPGNPDVGVKPPGPQE